MSNNSNGGVEYVRFFDYKITIKCVGTNKGKELDNDGVYQDVKRKKYAAFDIHGNKIGSAHRHSLNDIWDIRVDNKNIGSVKFIIQNEKF